MYFSHQLLRGLLEDIDNDEVKMVRTSQHYTPFVIELEDLGYEVDDVFHWISTLTDEWGDEDGDFAPDGEFLAICNDLTIGPGVLFCDEYGHLDTVVVLGDLLEQQVREFFDEDERPEGTAGRIPPNPVVNYSSRMKSKNFSADEYFGE